MTIQKGQKVVSRSGFVHTVARVHEDSKGRRWVVTESAISKMQDHYLESEFIARFVDQLPKSTFSKKKVEAKPPQAGLQGELM